MMWQGLERSFSMALAREGVQVRVAETTKTVLFRRKKDNGDSADWLEVCAQEVDGLQPGDVITTAGDNYLIANRDHRKNGVYSRFNAVRCNQTIELFREIRGTEPDKYGQYPIVKQMYATLPCYQVTQLGGLNKTAIGNVAGGITTCIIPAAPIDINTKVQYKTFDDEQNFTVTEHQLQAIDSTDTRKDEAGNLHGVIRLQIK